jgi:hypothetical protein
MLGAMSFDRHMFLLVFRQWQIARSGGGRILCCRYKRLNGACLAFNVGARVGRRRERRGAFLVALPPRLGRAYDSYRGMHQGKAGGADHADGRDPAFFWKFDGRKSDPFLLTKARVRDVAPSLRPFESAQTSS